MNKGKQNAGKKIQNKPYPDDAHANIMKEKRHAKRRRKYFSIVFDRGGVGVE
jgi:hypothetical protein